MASFPGTGVTEPCDQMSFKVSGYINAFTHSYKFSDPIDRHGAIG